MGRGRKRQIFKVKRRKNQRRKKLRLKSRAEAVRQARGSA